MLNYNHDYYIQVQGQMAVCGKEYRDFVCWTTKGIHIERLEYDANIFTEMKPALDQFFVVVLPEILTYNISGEGEQETILKSSITTEGTDDIYCICRGPECGKMIACDNPDCPIEWFHFSYINLHRKPRGKLVLFQLQIMFHYSLSN